MGAAGWGLHSLKSNNNKKYLTQNQKLTAEPPPNAMLFFLRWDKFLRADRWHKRAVVRKTTIYKISKLQRCIVQHREIQPIFCNFIFPYNFSLLTNHGGTGRYKDSRGIRRLAQFPPAVASYVNTVQYHSVATVGKWATKTAEKTFLPRSCRCPGDACKDED